MHSKKTMLEVQKIKAHLRLFYSVTPGSMLVTNIRIPVRKEVSQPKMADRRWSTIPEGEYVMFVGVVRDKNFDLPVLKLLWNQSIGYLHHDNLHGPFDKAFASKFSVVKK